MEIMALAQSGAGRASSLPTDYYPTPYIMPWYMGCVLILLSPIVLLPAIVFLSAVYGLRWTVQIASSIAHERESGMYELLVTSPPGMLGISRMIMSACLNRNETLDQTQAAGTWVMRGFFTIVLMLIAASVSPHHSERCLCQRWVNHFYLPEYNGSRDGD